MKYINEKMKQNIDTDFISQMFAFNTHFFASVSRALTQNLEHGGMCFER